MARDMSAEERRKFLMTGTRTAKLAVSRLNGAPHVVPIWFVLDGDDVVFTTGESTVKGKSLLRDGRVALCVDDDHPPFSFVSIEGTASVSRDLDELLKWATRARRSLHGRRPSRAVRPPQRGPRRTPRTSDPDEDHRHRRPRRLAVGHHRDQSRRSSTFSDGRAMTARSPTNTTGRSITSGCCKQHVDHLLTRLHVGLGEAGALNLASPVRTSAIGSSGIASRMRSSVARSGGASR